MSLSLALLGEALSRSLQAGRADDAAELFERALVEPYAFENGDPAQLILDAGRDAGEMTQLKELTVASLRTVSIERVRECTDPARALMRANTLFDLVRDLFRDQAEKSVRQKELGCLEQVWRDHVAWRETAGTTFLCDGVLSAWVDPVTIAEESLFQLGLKSSDNLRMRVSEIDEIKDEIYPTPMADYAFYTLLVHAVEMHDVDRGFAQSAGFVFRRRVAAWAKGNRYLLGYALFHALDIVNGNLVKKKELVDCLRQSVMEAGPGQGLWDELEQTCHYLKKPSDDDSCDILPFCKKRKGIALFPTKLGKICDPMEQKCA